MSVGTFFVFGLRLAFWQLDKFSVTLLATQLLHLVMARSWAHVAAIASNEVEEQRNGFSVHQPPPSPAWKGDRLRRLRAGDMDEVEDVNAFLMDDEEEDEDEQYISDYRYPFRTTSTPRSSYSDESKRRVYPSSSTKRKKRQWQNAICSLTVNVGS